MVHRIGSAAGLYERASGEAEEEALGISMFPLDCSQAPSPPPTTCACCQHHHSTWHLAPQHGFERFRCSRGAAELHLEPSDNNDDGDDECRCCLHDHNRLPAPVSADREHGSGNSITNVHSNSHPSHRAKCRCCTSNERARLNQIRPLGPTTTKRRGKPHVPNVRPLWLLAGTLLLCGAVLVVAIADAKSIDDKTHLTANEKTPKSLPDSKQHPHLTEPIKPTTTTATSREIDPNLFEITRTVISVPKVSNSNQTSFAAANNRTEVARGGKPTDEDILEPIKNDGDNATEDADEDYENDSSAGNDDDDVESCADVSCSERAEKKNLTDNDRLVELQALLKRQMMNRVKDASRYGMDVFSKLSLSGGCMNSLMSLSSGLAEIKSYAVKFVDASAKIPSGVMYGLLSDFGDFDECMSIKSNPLVAPEDEANEGSFSGKYCLLSVRLNLHIKLDKNTTLPEGIDRDGVLWDDLMRNYWTTNSSKGFQVGVCVPSRCTNDDIDQLYRHVAESYNAVGELMSCQDGADLNKQTTPDLVQRIILSSFAVLILLVIIGTIMDRYLLKDGYFYGYTNSGYPDDCLLLTIKLIASFSVIHNWTLFIQSNKSVDLATLRTSIRNRYSLNRISRSNNNNSVDDNNCSLLQKDHSFVSRSSRESGSTSGVNSLVNSDDRSSSFRPQIRPQQEQEQQSEGSAATDSPVVNAGQQSKQSNNKTLNSLHLTTDLDSEQFETKLAPSDTAQQLTVQIQPMTNYCVRTRCSDNCTLSSRILHRQEHRSSLKFLSGFRLFVINWITVGHSFLYPSAHNYQYYRSIINLSVTKNSVWFATTNFTLGIDMILYITGLVLVYKLANIDGSSRQSFRRRPNKTNWIRNVKTNAADGFIGSASPTERQQQQQQQQRQQTSINEQSETRKLNLSFMQLIKMIAHKILRFWPTYLTVIALAIVIPLCSDGPMWPEMVAKRIGSTCRRNWWSNLLMINNFLPESELCLPSSWFISVLMQLFLVGAIVIAIIGKLTHRVAVLVLTMLTLVSSAVSFWLAYSSQVRAPVIKMDETFVLEMDEKVFWLYTNLFNNMGPFLIGMLGGLLLIDAEYERQAYWCSMTEPVQRRSASTRRTARWTPIWSSACTYIGRLSVAIIVTCIAVAVLSSTFFDNHPPLWASTYWALHRIGWAIVTGYLIHNCALGRWKLLRDLFSLSTFEPISKLIFVAYLIYPILIHVHSGLVRDGLHVSIYNMMNIYITRLVLTFAIALVIHLFVELPFSSIEEQFSQYFYLKRRALKKNNNNRPTKQQLQQQVSRNENCKQVEEYAISMEDKSKPLLTIVPNHEKK